MLFKAKPSQFYQNKSTYTKRVVSKSGATLFHLSPLPLFIPLSHNKLNPLKVVSENGAN